MVDSDAVFIFGEGNEGVQRDLLCLDIMTTLQRREMAADPPTTTMLRRRQSLWEFPAPPHVPSFLAALGRRDLVRNGSTMVWCAKHRTRGCATEMLACVEAFRRKG